MTKLQIKCGVPKVQGQVKPLFGRIIFHAQAQINVLLTDGGSLLRSVNFRTGRRCETISLSERRLPSRGNSFYLERLANNRDEHPPKIVGISCFYTIDG